MFFSKFYSQPVDDPVVIPHFSTESTSNGPGDEVAAAWRVSERFRNEERPKKRDDLMVMMILGFNRICCYLMGLSGILYGI